MTRILTEREQQLLFELGTLAKGARKVRRLTFITSFLVGVAVGIILTISF
jgi:hypothetical protein